MINTQRVFSNIISTFTLILLVKVFTNFGRIFFDISFFGQCREQKPVLLKTLAIHFKLAKTFLKGRYTYTAFQEMQENIVARISIAIFLLFLAGRHQVGNHLSGWVLKNAQKHVKYV